jgi:hypothetical protein
VLWASGAVLDPAGNPVRSATVLASALDAAGAPLRGPAAAVAVAADGRFAVRGPPLEQRLAVRAIAPGFLASADELVLPGESGVRLRLQTAARWEGRVRIDDDVPPDSLIVVVVEGDREHRALVTEERVSVAGLQAGLVDVEVRTRLGDWLVARHAGLRTSAADVPEGARVDLLDLRGRLQRVQLALVDADGHPLERVHARVCPEAGSGSGSWPEAGAWIRAGRLMLVVPADARAVTLRARGRPALVAQLLDGVQELCWSR